MKRDAARNLLLAAILFAANLVANLLVDEYLRRPLQLGTADGWLTLLLTYSIIALPGLLAIAAAASALAHAEENASTGPRILVTGLLFVMAVACVWVHVESPSRLGPFAMGTMLLFGTALCDIFFVTDPAGRRTSYVWDRHRLRLHIDPNGNRTTLTYATLVNRNVGLQSIRDAQGGIFTFPYDSNDRLNALVDHLGHRSTLVWDANGNRIALVDCFGHRTSYVYNSKGQMVATVSPLGHRKTMVYDGQGQLVAEVLALSPPVDAEQEVGAALVLAEGLDEQLLPVGGDTEVRRRAPGVDARPLQALEWHAHRCQALGDGEAGRPA